jgi:son of sevenless-like protein
VTNTEYIADVPTTARCSGSMRGPRTEALRRSLHLSIDAAVGPYRQSAASVSETDLSPISSTRASIATSNTSWSGSGYDCDAGAWPPLTVLCLYDFVSDDPDHLPFRKDDLLDVVRQEDAGWWAAVRRDTEHVGWIPSAFVQELTDEEAEALLKARDAMKVWQPEDDEDDGSMPLFRGHRMSESDTVCRAVPRSSLPGLLMRCDA